jgi:hypothetical protein
MSSSLLLVLEVRGVVVNVSVVTDPSRYTQVEEEVLDFLDSDEFRDIEDWDSSIEAIIRQVMTSAGLDAPKKEVDDDNN